MKSAVNTSPTSLHSKINSMKMDGVFDSVALSKAEGELKKLEHHFKAEIKRQYANLVATFAMTRSNTIQITDTNRIAEIAFSLKSQAGMAGLQLVSEVAKSLYELCSSLTEDVSPEVYKVIKLHVDAIIDVYEGKFTADSSHLVRGLNALAKKFA